MCLICSRQTLGCSASRVSVTVTDASVQQQLSPWSHRPTVIREYHFSQFHKDKKNSPEIYMLGTGDIFVAMLSCHAWLRKRFLMVNQDTAPIKLFKIVTLLPLSVSCLSWQCTETFSSSSLSVIQHCSFFFETVPTKITFLLLWQAFIKTLTS